MHIRMPVAYTIRGTIGRTQRTYKFAEKAMIEIAETTANEAPISVSWAAHTDLSHYSNSKYSYLGHGGEDGLQFTRWYNGRHWLRLSDTGGIYAAPGRYSDLSGVGFENGLPMGHGYQVLGIPTLSPGRDHRKADGDPTERFVKIDKSARDQTHEELFRASQKLLSVDGVLHIACAQPGVCFARANFETLENDVVHIDTKASVLDGGDEDTFVFGLDEWDEIADIAIRSSHDRPKTIARLAALRPTVHLAESIDLDILTVRSADTFVKRFIRESYPKHINMNAYFRLSDPVAKEEYLRGILAEKRGAWELAGFPVQLLDLADEVFADARVDLGASFSLPKPF
ncbi:hypothetical protein O9X98_10920 [Agrobacterium salinitolerans]|nr:hypothetical protein [Agrobacterium salinitolerans]